MDKIGSLLDKAGVVNMDKGAHEELAVEPVHDASVTRDGVAKVLGGMPDIDKTSSEKHFYKHVFYMLNTATFWNCVKYYTYYNTTNGYYAAIH